MDVTDIPSDKRRQLIETQQTWAVWRELNHEKRRRFVGGMRWAQRNSGEYLLRKIGASERSLGSRNPQTEAIHDAFLRGREANKKLLRGISGKLDQLAPVNRAMGLGRLPNAPARIVRQFDELDLLGEKLFVVGTNSLYAYEALAGVHFKSGLLSTEDIDILLDARRRMSIASQEHYRADGLIGILQKTDRSFSPIRDHSYRASNKDGYLVDLICPAENNPMRAAKPRTLSDREDDIEGVEILGLEWLVNAPKIEAVTIDERGYPAPMVAIDPRVYALHKFWLSQREDRSKIKAARDLEQARAVAFVAANYLRLNFEAQDLSALPEAIRHVPAGLTKNIEPRDDDAPDW